MAFRNQVSLCCPRASIFRRGIFDILIRHPGHRDSAQRKPMLEVELSALFIVLAATR
jgi:hypothetical protein